MIEAQYSIEKLQLILAISRRTIRFYIEQGLLAPPAGRGRGGFYNDSHIERLRVIKQLQADGASLDEIRRRLPLPPPVMKPVSSAVPSPRFEQRVVWELADGMVLSAAADRCQLKRIARALEAFNKTYMEVDNAADKQ